MAGPGALQVRTRPCQPAAPGERPFLIASSIIPMAQVIAVVAAVPSSFQAVRSRS